MGGHIEEGLQVIQTVLTAVGFKLAAGPNVRSFIAHQAPSISGFEESIRQAGVFRNSKGTDSPL
jgi:hypothetical protein